MKFQKRSFCPNFQISVKIFKTIIFIQSTITHVTDYNIRNSSKALNAKKGKSPATSATCQLLDLASNLVDPTSGSGSGSGSTNLFEDIDPEDTTAPDSTARNSTSTNFIHVYSHLVKHKIC